MTGNETGGVKALAEVARAALQRAYAPYSGFRVGAALLSADGRVFSACNVENASYAASLCAERAAVAAAVSSGAREFVRMVIATQAEQPTPPCGICRQVLAELAPGIEVISLSADGGSARWKIAELLPTPFVPSSLNRQ